MAGLDQAIHDLEVTAFQAWRIGKPSLWPQNCSSIPSHPQSFKFVLTDALTDAFIDILQVNRVGP